MTTENAASPKSPDDVRREAAGKLERLNEIIELRKQQVVLLEQLQMVFEIELQSGISGDDIARTGFDPAGLKMSELRSLQHRYGREQWNKVYVNYLETWDGRRVKFTKVKGAPGRFKNKKEGTDAPDPGPGAEAAPGD